MHIVDSTICLHFCCLNFASLSRFSSPLNSVCLILGLFISMGKNKPTSTVVVQKVFEMSVAGDSPMKIGLFFDRSRRWARNILTNYSPESFSPIVIKKRGPERKTTEEEDELCLRYWSNALFGIWYLSVGSELPVRVNRSGVRNRLAEM